jgi:Tol biopolymer transport system component
MLRVAALSLLLCACASADVVERWSAAPVSSDQYESHPAFDPRTGDLYFVRSTPEFSGWRIFVSACDARGVRGGPQPAPFAGADGVEADPFFTPDGQTAFFISSRSEAGVVQRDLDIWRVNRGNDGAWQAPEHLPAAINSPAQEWFPRLAPDGWLYFGSSRRGGLGQTDIYRARPDDVGGWRVENLGPAINTAGDEYEAEISADGQRMILMADGDLYESRLRNGEWTQRVKLSDTVNTPAMEVGPLLAPDGQSLLFARDSGDASLSGEIYQLERGGLWPPRCRRR